MATRVTIPTPDEGRKAVLRLVPEPQRARPLARPDVAQIERRRGFVRARLATLRGVLQCVADVLSYVHDPRVAPPTAPRLLLASRGDGDGRAR